MVLFRANNENFLFTTIVCCVLLLALINCEKEVNGLNCYYKSKELMPDKSSEHKQNDSEPAALKQYECGLGDKYCVSLEGTLKALSRNYTFALKSCESDIQKYLTPISEKMGKDLEYKCSSGNEGKKNHTVGQLSYWYDCCSSNYCNAATEISTSIFTLLLIVFGLLISNF